jgi:hypothetical protein
MSSQLVKLVSGDTRPVLVFQVRDRKTGNIVDLTDSSISVFMKFRERGSATTLQDIACEKTDPESGLCKMQWPKGSLDVEAGRYDGEVYVNFDGEIQSDYEIIKFKLREGFADVT